MHLNTILNTKKKVVSDSHDSTDSEVVALWRTFAGRKKYREE